MLEFICDIKRGQNNTTTIRENVIVRIIQQRPIANEITGVITTEEKEYLFSINGDIDIMEQDLLVSKTRTYRVVSVEEHGSNRHPTRNGRCILKK